MAGNSSSEITTKGVAEHRWDLVRCPYPGDVEERQDRRHFSMHACSSNPAAVFNATLINDCFPILRQVDDTGFSFRWPAAYLAYAAVSRGNSISAAMLLRVGPGVGVVAAPVIGGERLFEPVKLPPAVEGGGVSLNIFDRVLPLTRESFDFLCLRATI